MTSRIARVPRRDAAVILTGIVLAFALTVVSEVRIVQRSAQADATSARILAAQEALGSAPSLNAVSRILDRRIAQLRLRAEPAALELDMLTELERAAAVQGVRVIGIHQALGMSTTLRSNPSFSARAFEIVLEGGYPQTLRSLVALARAPIVARVQRLSFERLRNQSPGVVRTSVTLDILRLIGGDAAR